MEDTDEPRPSRRATWIIVTMLVVVFVLYPLSSGPAYALLIYTGNPSGAMLALGIAYFPLFAVCQATGNERAIGGYVEWWIKLVQ